MMGVNGAIMLTMMLWTKKPTHKETLRAFLQALDDKLGWRKHERWKPTYITNYFICKYPNFSIYIHTMNPQPTKGLGTV